MIRKHAEETLMMETHAPVGYYILTVRTSDTSVKEI